MSDELRLIRGRAVNRTRWSLVERHQRAKEAELALREQTAVVELLQVVAVAANEAVTVDEAMRLCLNRVCAHSGWPVGHVYALAENGSGALASTAIWHLADPCVSLPSALRRRRFVSLRAWGFRPGGGEWQARLDHRCHRGP